MHKPVLQAYQNLSMNLTRLHRTMTHTKPVPQGVTFTNHGSRYIEKRAGFFCQRAKRIELQLILNETAKVTVETQNTGLFLFMGKPLAVIPHIQSLRLQMAKDSVNTDDMLVLFGDTTKAAYDPAEDALYRVGSGKVSLSCLSSDNVRLAINQLPLSLKGQTIGLNVGASATGTYTLNLKELKQIPQSYLQCG